MNCHKSLLVLRHRSALVFFAANLALSAAAQTVITYDTSPTASNTFLTALNLGGTVAGDYIDPSTGFHGFFREAAGNFTDIAPTGATLTVANSINDSGTAAGSWVVSSRPAKTHGFVRNSSGVYTTFDIAGATSLTVAGINNSGAVAGTITTFDAPSPNIDLHVFGINDSGTITGWAGNGLASGTVYHGFVWQGLKRSPIIHRETVQAAL